MNSADLEQGTQEWLDARLGKVTASRISAVMSKPRSKGQSESTTRRNYMAQVACEILTGKSAEVEFESFHTRRGKELEPEARIEYELRNSLEVRKVGFIDHPTIPRFGCSPDAFVGDKGMAQFKCPIPAYHFDYIKSAKLKIVPAEYYAQVQCELSCNPEREWNDFVSYNKQMPDHLQLVVIRAFRDEQFISEMEAAVMEFTREVDSMIGELPKSESVVAV